MMITIKFGCCAKIKIDDYERDKIAPQDQQVKQLREILMSELDCECVDITDYDFELVSED